MTGYKIAVVCCVLALALHGGFAPAGAQSAEVSDFALFYEALAPYGKWIDYGKYGPVWYPTGVSDEWRPYLDGRWVPTEEGWVFETGEPWGWATYHYGNWFPTIEYGWVWAPGSTWYPSTAVWRTSDDYIGWAPLPPPDYEPVPAFYPEGGYYPGTPMWDLLTPPFWNYCPTSRFLLGFGQPFLPSYSYWNCGCLTPFTWSPFLAFRTFFLPEFFFSSFAPGAFFAFGPAFPFIARVASVNLIVINKFAKDVHFRHLKNVLPPKDLLDRHPFIRKAIPDPVFQGERFAITPVKDAKLAEANLLKPNAAPLPVGVPKVSREIPKALALPHRQRVGPEALQGVKGMALPDKAVSRVAVPSPTLAAPQPAAPAETRRAPFRLETREDAGARMIEVAPPGRRPVSPPEPRVTRGAPLQLSPAEDSLRRQQQEQLRALEQRQQRVLDGQRQERETLRQRQQRQQEIFRDQQRLLEQRQLRQQERLQRQQEEVRLEQQLQRRDLQRQQQFRPELRAPRGASPGPYSIQPRGGGAPTLRQMPMQPAPARPAIQTPGGGAPRGGAARSFSGRSSGGSGRSGGSLGGGGGMGFGPGR